MSICCKNCETLAAIAEERKQELETICKAFDIEYGHDEETGAIVGRCNKLIEKEKVLEEYKQSLDEKNKFLQDLGISASGEFKRIKFYIEDLKNKYNEKVKEYEELISEKDFYLQKIETLEEKLNAQFAEMKEKLTAEEMKNYELKKKLRDLELKNTILQNRYQQLDGSMTEFNRYRKALEGIEKVINNILNSCLGRNTVSCRPAHNVCGDLINILDIINKARG